jgi:hypothetical protein
MVKYFAMIAFVLGTLVVADSAFAIGRHCRSCGNGGGCPGGNCSVSYAPSKSASTTNAPPVVASEAPASAPVATAAQPQTAQTYAYNTGRRGLFGRR